MIFLMRGYVLAHYSVCFVTQDKYACWILTAALLQSRLGTTEVMVPDLAAATSCR